MKKFIKVFGLILFIIFVLGITTSEAALQVTSSTTADDMIEELNNGGYLTGISNSVRISNPYLYCRQRYQSINSSAKYYKAGSVSYPEGDQENGYAKAYILAAPASIYGENTSNGLRQKAWWYILGANEDDEGNRGQSGSNELLVIAKEYQNYKKREIPFAVNYVKMSKINDNILIYGPIKLDYSYGYKKSGSYSDEWGGFDYAFFDGNTAVTSGITLCSYGDGTYPSINTSGVNGNYNKVRTNDYCYDPEDKNTELYVKVDLSEITNINKINLDIKVNKVDYNAEVYNIEGQYTTTYSYYDYCSVCEGKAIKYYTGDSYNLYNNLYIRMYSKI